MLGHGGRKVPPAKVSHARIQFVLASLAVGALVATVGWLSDLRAMFHLTIIVLSVAAFLPLLLALALVLNECPFRVAGSQLRPIGETTPESSPA